MEVSIVYFWLESLFNFVEVWIFMFFFFLFVDCCGGEFLKILIWSMVMFFINIFLLLYMVWCSIVIEFFIEE